MCTVYDLPALPNQKLLNGPERINTLGNAVKERLSLGQVRSGNTDLKSLNEKLNKRSENHPIFYHRECPKPLVNRINIDKLRKPQSREFKSPPSKKGRKREAEDTPERPKRDIIPPKAKVCVFRMCGFKVCNDDDVHQVFSPNVGESLMHIRDNTSNDRVRSALSDLIDLGDAAAKEKHYHRHCLEYAKRTCAETYQDETRMLRTLCDQQLVACIQNSLQSREDNLTICEINTEYVSILEKCHINLCGSRNYKKHIKKLILENMPEANVIASVLKEGVSQGIDKLEKSKSTGSVGDLERAALVLRKEIMSQCKWKFR